MEYVKWSP